MTAAGGVRRPLLAAGPTGRALACLALLAPAAFAQPMTNDSAPAATDGASMDAAAPPSLEQERVGPPLPPTPASQPYQVQVRVSFSRDAALPAPLRATWLDELQQLLSGRYRGGWRLTLSEDADQDWVSPEALAAQTESGAGERWTPLNADKALQLCVDTPPGETLILCREWDAATKTLGALYRQPVADQRTLPIEMADLIAAAFRPIVEIDVVEGERIEGLVRAGEFPPHGVNLAPVQTGDYLVPYLRYLDRSKQVRLIQPVPWTYLKVDEIERARLRLGLVSAFRTPLPAVKRRVEITALRVRPHLPETEVLIYPRGGRRNPLAGFRCEALPRMATAEDPVEDRIKLSTDRRGVVTVPANLQHPLQYLQVYSGQALLARVPILPGVAEHLEVEVPDDRARLSVEGEVQLLDGELVDIVATREVLISRTRAYALQNRWDDVDRLLRELQALPTLEQFLTRIETMQVQAVYAAQLAKDRVAEGRIKKLCAGIKETAGKHLDPFRLTEFRQEIAALRKKK